MHKTCGLPSLRIAAGCQALEHDIEAASARAQDGATKMAELLEKIQLQESGIADVQKKVPQLFLKWLWPHLHKHSTGHKCLIPEHAVCFYHG